MRKARSLSNKSSHKGRCPSSSSPRQSCMSNDKTVVVHTGQVSRKGPLRQDWVYILGQIQKVTQKVKKLCKQDSKSKSIRAKVQSRAMSIRNSIQKQYQNTHPQTHQQTSTRKQHNVQNKQQHYQNYCNPACHHLMNQCIKLNSQNQMLYKQKQALQKRLFFQSKEKRQLRWRLQKQQQLNKFYDFKNLQSNFLTLKSSQNKMPTKVQVSQISLSAKKTSPLKQKCLNMQNISNNSLKYKNKLFSQKGTPFKTPLREQYNNTDSLLIQQTIQDNKKSEYSKVNKSISLEKDLNELLQVCKFETNKDRKRIIRKQMQKLAFQIKNLRE